MLVLLTGLADEATAPTPYDSLGMKANLQLSNSQTVQVKKSRLFAIRFRCGVLAASPSAKGRMANGEAFLERSFRIRIEWAEIW
jgi:hypothetical protein